MDELERPYGIDKLNLNQEEQTKLDQCESIMKQDKSLTEEQQTFLSSLLQRTIFGEE